MPEPKIEEAVKAFTLWRFQRRGKTHTPNHLKEMAVSLLSTYPIGDICNRLALNRNTLKGWEGLSNSSPPARDFITIEPEKDTSAKPTIGLQLTTANGIDCKLSGPLDPSFIARLLQNLQEAAL